jgi:hypothetical protein
MAFESKISMTGSGGPLPEGDGDDSEEDKSSKNLKDILNDNNVLMKTY